MASFFYTKISQDDLIWCVNILHIFKAEIMKFRSLVLETGDPSLAVNFVTSILHVCKKMEHISYDICCLMHKKQCFIKNMTALLHIQNKLKDITSQAKISTVPLAMRVYEDEKCTKEESKANVSEEKPLKENIEGKKNEGDPAEAKPLKKDSEQQKTNPGETTISEKEVEGDLKGEKPAEEDAGKPS